MNCSYNFAVNRLRAGGALKLAVPVTSRPVIRELTSCVPSYVYIGSKSQNACRNTRHSFNYTGAMYKQIFAFQLDFQSIQLTAHSRGKHLHVQDQRKNQNL